MAQKPVQETFIQAPGLIRGISMFLLFFLLPLMAFKPDLLPMQGLPYYQLILDYNRTLRILLYIVMTLHLTEAVVAVMICAYMDTTVNVARRWGVSVFVTGEYSFWLLMTVLYQYELEQDPKKPRDLKEEFGIVT